MQRVLHTVVWGWGCWCHGSEGGFSYLKPNKSCLVIGDVKYRFVVKSNGLILVWVLLMVSNDAHSVGGGVEAGVPSNV
jgi:hypothetical protein